MAKNRLLWSLHRELHIAPMSKPDWKDLRLAEMKLRRHSKSLFKEWIELTTVSRQLGEALLKASAGAASARSVTERGQVFGQLQCHLALQGARRTSHPKSMQQALDMYHALDRRSQMALSDEANQLRRADFPARLREALLVAMTTMDSQEISRELATATTELSAFLRRRRPGSDDYALLIHEPSCEVAPLVLMAERILCENCCNPYKMPLEFAHVDISAGANVAFTDINVNADALEMTPKPGGTQLTGVAGVVEESPRPSVSVLAATRLVETAQQHPRVKNELVMPAILRAGHEAPGDAAEVPPVAILTADDGGRRSGGEGMTSVAAKPLAVTTGTAAYFEPVEPPRESIEAAGKSGTATRGSINEAQKTRELSEEEKIYLEIERVRRILFKMDLKELMEIRSYPRPPAGLEPLLKCNLVLLGYEDSELKTWADIKKKITKVGTFYCHPLPESCFI